MIDVDSEEVSFISIDYNVSIEKSEIFNIHKYLMAKNIK